MCKRFGVRVSVAVLLIIINGVKMELFFGVLLILVAHYIADFYFQSREIAMKKSHEIKALITHIMIYSFTLCIMIFLGLYFMGIVSVIHAMQIAIGVSLVNGLLHYLIDFVTSQMSTHFWKTKQTRNFWLTIGADQLIHTGLLIYCYAEMLENFKYI